MTTVLTGATIIAGGTAAQAATPTCNGYGYVVGKWWPDWGLSYDLIVRAPVYNPGSSQTWRCTLREGNYNNWGVRALQDDINRCYGTKYTGGVALSVDGNFGPKTKRALRNVQAYHRNLVADGVYGPNTAAEMFHVSRRSLERGAYDHCDRIPQ